MYMYVCVPLCMVQVVVNVVGHPASPGAVEVRVEAIEGLEPHYRRRVLVQQLSQQRRATAHVRYDHHLQEVTSGACTLR